MAGLLRVSFPIMLSVARRFPVSVGRPLSCLHSPSRTGALVANVFSSIPSRSYARRSTEKGDHDEDDDMEEALETTRRGAVDAASRGQIDEEVKSRFAVDDDNDDDDDHLEEEDQRELDDLEDSQDFGDDIRDKCIKSGESLNELADYYFSGLKRRSERFTKAMRVKRKKGQARRAARFAANPDLAPKPVRSPLVPLNAYGFDAVWPNILRELVPGEHQHRVILETYGRVLTNNPSFSPSEKERVYRFMVSQLIKAENPQPAAGRQRKAAKPNVARSR